MERPHLLAVAGPTAGGKTALSVRLAERLGGEILSCDSMQIYRGMDIGTAKPTWEERCGIAHHLIDIADPTEPFSAADYVEAAGRAAAEVLSRGKLPILCGGTGLYLDAFLRGGFEDTVSDPSIREALFSFASAHGAHALHERLRAVDPESAESIHENNVKRVVRALEVWESTGMTKTALDRKSREIEPPYRATVVCLSYPDRAQLYDRIERRVTEMLENGLAEETARLEQEGVFARNSTAAQAIGYKEILPYLHGECSLCEATQALQAATRRYAKRQLTWFRARPYVTMVHMTDEAGTLRPLDAVADEVIALFQEAKNDL